MPLILAFRRKRQGDICKFETTLVYRVKFQDNLDYTEKPVLTNQTNLPTKQTNIQQKLAFKS